jgi:hypothetical protein
MAGRGPAPKPKEQRRNRHEPSRGEWVDLPELAEPVLPPLDPAHEWHPRTTAQWEAWRADPASGMFGPAEVAAAVELAWLADEFASGGNPDLKIQRVSAAELRLRMDGLGLTAKGKRDLRWRTGGEQEAAKAEVPLAEVRELRAV